MRSSADASSLEPADGASFPVLGRRPGESFRAGAHMFHIKAWRIAYAVAFGFVGATLPSVGSAEYLLAPSDVIEVGVASVPDLRQRARVDSEGEVSLAYL